MTGAERRGDTRTAIELRVEYTRLNTFFHDYTKNISKGGTFIQTDRPLPIGTLFLFKLVIPELAEPLVLHGEVRWIVKVEGEGDPATGEGPPTVPGMGIRFLWEDEASRAEVTRTVEDLMVRSLGPIISAHLREVE